MLLLFHNAQFEVFLKITNTQIYDSGRLRNADSKEDRVYFFWVTSSFRVSPKTTKYRKDFENFLAIC